MIPPRLASTMLAPRSECVRSVSSCWKGNQREALRRLAFSYRYKRLGRGGVFVLGILLFNFLKKKKLGPLHVVSVSLVLCSLDHPSSCISFPTAEIKGPGYSYSCVCMWKDTHVCTCGSQRTISGVVSWMLSTSILSQISHWPGAHLIY